MKFQIETFLEKLSEYSKEGPGVTRLPFTKESQGAWEYICKVMEDLGLRVKTDAYGTILGHLEGQRKESIVIGSHYDSVVEGGKYDGTAGIAIALMAAACLAEQGIRPSYSLDILATNDEEGVTFSNGFLSSKRICGLLKEEEYVNQTTGRSLAGCLAENWYTKDGKGQDDIRLETSLKHAVQYIEPHIEQGGILWENQEQIGIVKHIVGVTRLYVTVHGISNHAGSTPMEKRKDALAAAARMIGKIPELASRYEGAVATVGQLICSPNVINIIPNQVKFTVDIRSASDKDRHSLTNAVKELVKEHSPMEYEIAEGVKEAAVPMKEELVEKMERLCEEKGISHRVMNSGAAHDAQLFGAFLDTVMLFVPSKDGISHSPAEYTRMEDMERAAELLYAYLTNMG